MRRVLLGLFAATAVMTAQAVDLTAPAVQANAASMGVPWQGPRIKLIDEVGGYSSKSVLALYHDLACMANAIVVGHTDTWLTHISGWQNSLLQRLRLFDRRLEFNDTGFPRLQAGKAIFCF